MRHAPVEQADWDEAEVSWAGLTPEQRAVAEREYRALRREEWTEWAARREARRRALTPSPSPTRGAGS